MLSFKSNCRLLSLKPQIVVAMLVTESVMQKMGHECLITSVDDSKHMDKSLHYSGLAFDIRVHDLQDFQVNLIVTALKGALTPEFDVIYETFPDRTNNHIHIEYDPKLDLPKPKLT